jgi:hypothetical protein
MCNRPIRLIFILLTIQQTYLKKLIVWQQVVFIIAECRDVYKDFCKRTKKLCDCPMVADYCRITCKLCSKYLKSVLLLHKN